MTSDTTPDDRTTMAKTQKTMYLNSDICELLADVEERSGATFTRLMTAASLCLLFGRYHETDPPLTWNPGEPTTVNSSPDSLWVRLAVSLERGEFAVENAIAAVLDYRQKELDSCLKFLKEHDAMNNALGEMLEREGKFVSQCKQQWECMAAELGSQEATKRLLEQGMRSPE
jgi:hypothetical protein